MRGWYCLVTDPETASPEAGIAALRAFSRFLNLFFQRLAGDKRSASKKKTENDFCQGEEKRHNLPTLSSSSKTQEGGESWEPSFDPGRPDFHKQAPGQQSPPKLPAVALSSWMASYLLSQPPPQKRQGLFMTQESEPRRI